MKRHEIREKEAQISELLKEFCALRLDEEYAELAQRMTCKLGRKKNVLFASGRPEVWAAAIIFALSTLNFTFDSSSNPHISIEDVDAFFGTKKASLVNRSFLIRDTLKINSRNKAFLTTKMKNNKSVSDLVMINGCMIPVSALSEEFQETIKMARGQNL
jgi:hypothetical protein